MAPVESITPNPRYWRNLGNRARQVILLALQYVAEDVWGGLRKEAPVDHGRLAGSFQLKKMGEITYRIFSKVEYALAVHEGTKPHIIRPRTKKALAFAPVAAHSLGGSRMYRTAKRGKLSFSSANAEKIVRKVVHHPGTKANRYGDRAIDATKARMNDLIGRAIDETAGAI